MLGGRTRMEGGWVNASATIAFPMGENVFILACINDRGPHLKMVKIRVTGETTYEWIEARVQRRSYPTNCKAQETFTVEECWNNGVTSNKFGTIIDESLFSVVLVAKLQESQRKKPHIGKNYILNKTFFSKDLTCEVNFHVHKLFFISISIRA